MKSLKIILFLSLVISLGSCGLRIINKNLEKEFISEKVVVIDESYAIDQIIQLSHIQNLINLGTNVNFMIEEDAIVNEMIGYSIQVYEYQLDHIATISWYFMEYKTGDLYMMDIAQGEYIKIE